MKTTGKQTAINSPLFSKIFLAYLAIALMLAPASFASPVNQISVQDISSESSELGLFGQVTTVTNGINSLAEETSLLVRTQTLIPVQGRATNVTTGAPLSSTAVDVCIDDGVIAANCTSTATDNTGLFSTSVNFNLEDPH